MNKQEIKDFIFSNAIKKSNEKYLTLELTLNSVVSLKLSSFDINSENDNFCYLNVETPYEVNNLVPPDLFQEFFAEHLAKKYNKDWFNDADFMIKTTQLDIYPDYISMDNYGNFTLLDKSDNNSEFYDEFKLFLSDKVFQCPAIPPGFMSKDDNTFIQHDEGNWAYCKNVSLDKLVSLINFNGGLKLENKRKLKI